MFRFFPWNILMYFWTSSQHISVPQSYLCNTIIQIYPMGTTCAKPLQCEFRENCLDQHNHQLAIVVSIAVSRVWMQRVRVVQGCENSSWGLDSVLLEGSHLRSADNVCVWGIATVSKWRTLDSWSLKISCCEKTFLWCILKIIIISQMCRKKSFSS